MQGFDSPFVLSSSEERLAHLAFQRRSLERIPLVAKDTLVSCHRLLVVRQRFGICCHSSRLVTCFEQILLRLLPRLGLCVVIVWLVAGCATVFQGTSTNVDVSSDPSGAKVYVNGHQMGTTPVTLRLETKHVYHLEFKKEGFETKSYTITNHVGVGWVVLDVILGLIPVVVDAATGAWYELDQECVNALLEAQQ